MPELQALSTPLIADRTLKRLLGFARPKQHTAASTHFDMGYERCKQDLLQLVYHEIGLNPEIPEQHVIAKEALQPVVSHHRAAAKAASKPWWSIL